MAAAAAAAITSFTLQHFLAAGVTGSSAYTPRMCQRTLAHTVGYRFCPGRKYIITTKNTFQNHFPFYL
jgi:hypothetical protein